MERDPQKEYDIKRIQKEMNLSDKSVAACPISQEELKKIYEDYCACLPGLEKLRTEILSTINEGMAREVHSIRCRVKQPDHLIAKIVRGAYRNPAKYMIINVDNYKKMVTDLIGVRIIILDRRDWKAVHDALLRLYRDIPERYMRRPVDMVTNYDRYYKEVMRERSGPMCGYLAERPAVYIASEEDRKLYNVPNMRIDNSKTHYRSVHYIVRYREVYFEIQMRSLFEEGWLEFDRHSSPHALHRNLQPKFINRLQQDTLCAF